VGTESTCKAGDTGRHGFDIYTFICLWTCVCVHAQSLQSCLTLCDPMDCSLPSSSVHGILQARILKWLPCPPPGDLPNLGIKPDIPHCRQILYRLSPQERTRINEYMDTDTPHTEYWRTDILHKIHIEMQCNLNQISKGSDFYCGGGWIFYMLKL